MFNTDEEIRAQALNLWANHIETGNVTLNALDVQARNQSLPPNKQMKLHALDDSQKALVLRIRGLAKQELTSRGARLEPQELSLEKTSYPRPGNVLR